jgi:hypothetical protein
MRAVLALVFLSTFAFAQDPAAIAAAESACGPKGVKFTIKEDNSQHAVGQPEDGKALVYVVQEIGNVICPGGCLTTKIALDGAWMGANHGNSYLAFAVSPGERHRCVNWQSHFASMSSVFGLAHFTAEAGKVYFFRSRTIGSAGPTFFDIEPIDSDQGKLFIASSPMAISQPKK